MILCSLDKDCALGEGSEDVVMQFSRTKVTLSGRAGHWIVRQHGKSIREARM